MKEIPDDLIEYTSQEHGTIVLWSDADRISWKKATTVFEKCENKIGRMYRYWLNDGSIKLRMVLLDQNGHILPNGDNYFRAVDPLFLMENAKYEDSPEKPMFEIYRNRYLKNYQVEVNGEIKQATVEMNFSIAKKSIRYSDDDEKLIPGNKKYGKLAKECIGVSIVRENRELELCDSWYMARQKDPRHRWWGAEIKFDSILDEVFGVTNNKQSANHLTELARKNIEELNSEFNLSTNNLDEDLKQLQDDSPNSYILYDVITQIQSTISKMDASVEGQLRTTKAHKANRHESDVKTKSMYDDLVTKRSKDEETRSTTDLLVEERGENRAPSVEQSISKNPEYSSEDRKKILDDVTLGHRCSIVAAPVDSSSFFNIVAEDTQMIIKLNTQHPMYDKLFGVFDSILCGGEDAETTKIMVRDAFDSVQFLLASWARMEDESKTAEQRISYRRIREQWGSILEESFKP